MLARLADKRDDLIALTQALVRIPTLNPPGDHYHDICEFLDRRLSAHGFATRLIRAHGPPAMAKNTHDGTSLRGVAAHRNARGARQRAPIDPKHQFHPWRSGRIGR